MHVDVARMRSVVSLELHLGRVEHRVLLVGLQRVLRRAASRGSSTPSQVPAVRARHAAQLFLGFRQRDVQHRLAVRAPFEQELQREGGLARAGRALHR